MVFGLIGDLANPAASSNAFGLLGEPKSAGSCSATALGFAGLANSTEETTGFLRDPKTLFCEKIGSLIGVGWAMANADRGIFEGLIIDEAAIVSSAGSSLTALVCSVIWISFFSSILVQSWTSTCFLSMASSSSSSSAGSATFSVFDVFVARFGTAGFLVVEALRDGVLIASVLGPVDFAVGAFFTAVSFDAFFSVFSSFVLGAVVLVTTLFSIIVSFDTSVSSIFVFSLGAAVVLVDFGATVFAAEAFVVAILADVDAFDTELFNGADFGAISLCAGLGATALGAGFEADSSSVFFGLPRRTGALRRLDLGGEEGGISFACARCALVRTILNAGLV